MKNLLNIIPGRKNCKKRLIDWLKENFDGEYLLIIIKFEIIIIYFKNPLYIVSLIDVNLINMNGRGTIPIRIYFEK